MVKLVKQVLERCEIVVAVLRIHIVVNGNETNVMLREEHFREIAGLQIFTPETGQVLYDDC